MDSAENELSHEEIWDDSALIESWNDALAEYKTYHSIHAKRGRVEDLDTHIKNQQRDDEQANGRSGAAQSDLEVKSDDVDSDHAVHPALESETVAAEASAADTSAAERSVPAPPLAVLGSVQDEGLKKLLMAWYYAGYFTGLYEGQQQAQKQ